MEVEISIALKEFINETDLDRVDSVWEHQSKTFRSFWEKKILNSKYPELTDTEIDEIILIP